MQQPHKLSARPGQDKSRPTRKERNKRIKIRYQVIKKKQLPNSYASRCVRVRACRSLQALLFRTKHLFSRAPRERKVDKKRGRVHWWQSTRGPARVVLGGRQPARWEVCSVRICSTRPAVRVLQTFLARSAQFYLPSPLRLEDLRGCDSTRWIGIQDRVDHISASSLDSVC